MDWVVLIVSGVFEAVWAAALAASNGFRRLWPAVIYVAASIVSLGGLAWAMVTISVGTAYAVWVGVGASLTVCWAIYRRQERATVARLSLVTLLVLSVIGLKAVS